MFVRCSSLMCGCEVRKDWNFCPYCGVDQRPDESRVAIDECIHPPTPDKFCVRCGAQVNQGGPNQTGENIVLGFLDLT